MRTSLFYALNGALGVVAHESLAYFKIESGKEEHRSLDGCGKYGKHKWVPDPSTFVFPQNDYKPGNSWDLCVDSAHCAPHEALSKVTFDFKDNAIVFNFKHIEHYKYEDVVVYVERGKPPTEHSQKYSKESDHCKIVDDYKKAKCHIPYFSLTDGGSYDELCPIKDNGGWRLYIKIKAKISHGYKKYGLYSRAGDIHEKYFTLSYTCAECKEHKHKEGKYEVIEEVEDYPEEKKKKYDEYKHKEEKKYDDYEEEGKEKYKRGAEEEEEEEKKYKEEEKEKEFRHEHHHKHHHHHGHEHDHKHGHKHGHLHGHLHKEHHYNHHNKHHGYGKDHEHKHYEHDHHDPHYLHEHKDYKHGDHGHHHDEHKHYEHYDPSHHHHDDYKHHEYYDPSRHHDHDSFLNDFFKKYGHYDYHNGKHHYEHHDGYHHHHARDLADKTKDESVKKSEKSEHKHDEHKHKHGHHHGHHHDHDHDHHHKHRHSHHDYHHYEHYDPGYHHDHKYHDYDHKHHDYDHKHHDYDHKHHDHKHHDYDHKHHDYDHKHHDYDHKHHDHKHHDYDHKHHDHKHHDYKHHENKHHGHHHEHNKHYEHHDPSYHYEHHKHYEHHDPSYHHEHHHGDKYGNYKHHDKRSEEHHGKHYEEPVTVYYKEKAEDVNAKANHVIYEKVQKHEIPAHIYKKLAEAKKHHYDHEHEKTNGHGHEHKYGHDNHKHAEEQYHQKKLAEAKLAKAMEEYYATYYGKQHKEHKKHGHSEHRHKQPEYRKYQHENYENKYYKPEKHHGHHQHKEHNTQEPEERYYEQKEYKHKTHVPEKEYFEKKENERKKHDHSVHEHKQYGPKVYYEYNKHGHENKQKHHDKYKEYEPEKSNHGHYKYKEPHHGSDLYRAKKEFLEKYKYDGENIHTVWEKLYKAKVEKEERLKQKTYEVKRPSFYRHSGFKRAALPDSYHGDEVVEIDTAKVEKYIEKAEHRINEGISKAIYKGINSAGDDPSTGTIIKFYNKVEAAIKYIVSKNLKTAVIHIAEIDGVKEPAADDVVKFIYKAVKHILKAADKIFTKSIDALGEDPTEKEVEYAIAKIEKLLARVVDKSVREAIVEIFDLEYVTENSYGEYEKYDKRQATSAQNVTAPASNTTATNATAQATTAIGTKAANRFMRLFMRQDSQNATQSANTTAQAANVTETQTLMRFMRRQVQNATDAAVNATAQAANTTETQTLMRFMRRQAQNATDAAINATAKAVADVNQALNATSQAVNVTQAQNTKRTEVYSDSKVEKVVEKAAEKAADKLLKKIDEEDKLRAKRDTKQSKRAKFYNGYVPECKGKIIKAYGIDGLHSAPLKDFSADTHPNTCKNHQGDYILYSYEELINTVYGKLYESHGGDTKFGNFFIELVKARDGYGSEIVVSLDVSDKYQYEATEAKVFVGCSPGLDNQYDENICSEKTYPYLAVAEKGLNEFVFAIPDKYQCNEYFVAIVVDFCDNKHSS